MFSTLFMQTFSHIGRDFIKPLYHSLLPCLCIFCGKRSLRPLNTCLPCQQSLPILAQHCAQCAQILPGAIADTICGNCLNSPPPFTRTYALFPYEAPIIQVITGLKFNHHLSHALALGELLHQKIQQEWYRNQPLPDLIVPVPLHPKRLKERGFNQSIEIARRLARLVPLDISGVERIKNTQAQSGLLAPERAKNIAGAFALKKNYAGLSIAVIDDVITTGHTILELCRLLKQNGAAQIHVWCCARRS